MTTRPSAFAILCRADPPFLVVAQSSKTALSNPLVEQLARRCNFCGKDRSGARALAGCLGSGARICDECVDLVLAIVGRVHDTAADSNSATSQSSCDELVNRLASLSSAGDALEGVRFGELSTLFPEYVAGPPSVCSFCGAPGSGGVKIVSGPRCFICEACVLEIAAQLRYQGREPERL